MHALDFAVSAVVPAYRQMLQRDASLKAEVHAAAFFGDNRGRRSDRDDTRRRRCAEPVAIRCEVLPEDMWRAVAHDVVLNVDDLMRHVLVQHWQGPARLLARLIAL